MTGRLDLYPTIVQWVACPEIILPKLTNKPLFVIPVLTPITATKTFRKCAHDIAPS